MRPSLRQMLVFLPTLLLAFFFVFMQAPSAHASGTLFYVDLSFDASGRSRISASELFTGIHARYFVEDDFVATLNTTGRAQLDGYLKDLSDTFDKQMYPRETTTYGYEWRPGIDDDYKIIVLLTRMQNGAGGYFRSEDENPQTEDSPSNAHEMVYLNVNLIAKFHTKEFLAHEFQHLINYNQKNRAWNKAEEVWLNEMMSEAAPWVAGLYEGDFPYENSNLHDRVGTFLAASSDALLDWPNKVDDYGVGAIVAAYMYNQYGSAFFTALSLSQNTGVAAVNDALAQVASDKTFKDIFQDWMAAVLLNNCAVSPQNLYCFKHPSLTYDNVHIAFAVTRVGGSSFSSKQNTADWQGNWYRYQRSMTDTPLYLNVSFSSPSSRAAFSGKYVLTYGDGHVIVGGLPLFGQSAFWSVASFGPAVVQLDIVLSDFFEAKPTTGTVPVATFDLLAAVEEKKVGYLLTQQPAASSKQPAPSELGAGSWEPEAVITDGDLIRAQGDTKVYIAKIVCSDVCHAYRRWIQTPELFAMYGHLYWENIKDISQIVMAEYQESSLVRLAGSAQVYLTDAVSAKHWIETERAFLDRGYQWDMIYIINDAEYVWYHAGASLRS